MDQLLDILRNLGETAVTISKIYTKLRKGSRGQYLLLAFCTFLSVLLISSFGSDVLRADGTEFSAGGWRYQKNGFSAASNYRLRLLRSPFTVYASSLFFRNKSREYGILMALGMQKKTLRALLFKELSLITVSASFWGSCARRPFPISSGNCLNCLSYLMHR